MSIPRSSSDYGGGIGALFKEELRLQSFSTGQSFRTFEHACFTDMAKSVYYFAIYRPPPSTENGFKTSEFLSEFDSFIDFVNSLGTKFLLVGDFNVHVDTPTKWDASHFLTTLSTSSLLQHVIGPTHKHGHTLDLVISRETDNLITDCFIDSLLSDHHVVTCIVHCPKPLPAKKLVSTRKFSRIDAGAFEHDLLHRLGSNNCSNVEELVDLYQKSITETLDLHAPLQTSVRSDRRRQPWYNNEINAARNLRRKHERKWRKSRLDVHRELYVTQRNHVNDLIDKAKQDYYRGELEGADTKTVFKTVNKLLNKSAKTLPAHDSAKNLANEFATFFDDKVSKIYDGIESELMNSNLNLTLEPSKSASHGLARTLSVFDHVSEEDIQKYITKSPAKSCLLDPIPTWFIKQNVSTFVPIITQIVNSSLSTGTFPESLKHAVISPVIKKQSLNLHELKNYRPVSNIPYLSKIIERHAVDNIARHMTENNLEEPLQSAYRPAHSTESALLKVKCDIMEFVSQRKGVFLALLDLSAAFDTVNHEILLTRLANEIGLQGNVLKWISSYLAGRTTCVHINSMFSERLDLKYGIPQGSIVGPQQFSIYTIPIGAILRKHNLLFHIYADDIQLYTCFDPKDHNSIITALSRMSACIDEVRLWMTVNRLKFNENKTEFFVAVAKHLKHLMPPVTLRVGNNIISPSDCVRNLGIIFDTSMTMAAQITSLCTSLNYQMRNISRIRRFLDKDTCHLIVRALILSRLDYGNSLLFGSNSTDVQRLQRIQNWAAKLICRALKRDHATPYLNELHWLPVRERIIFKILVFVYKCLIGTAPGYLTSCLSPYQPGRASLRSASDITRLHEPNSIKLLQSGANRTFSIAAPHAWNKLSINIRQSNSLGIFKKALKTHLYPI